MTASSRQPSSRPPAAGEDLKQAAQQAEDSEAVAWLARLGLVSRGIVWLVIGLLALSVAAGNQEKTDRNGALRAIAEQPLGEVLLLVLVVGFLGYAAWRGLSAAVGHRDQAEPQKRWRKRAVSASRAVLYTGFAVSTLTFLLQGGGGQDNTAPMTARVMSHTGGRSLVFAVGVAVVIGGLATAVRGARRKQEDRLEGYRVPQALRKPVIIVGVVGLVGRGLVIALIGSFLVKAAVQFKPDEAKGLDAALKTVAEQAYGRGLLFAAALALVAFALWSFVEAAYRET